jgi:site-specific recombinase XerD
LKFAEDVDSDRLFPGLLARQITAWFTRKRDNTDILNTDDYGNRKVFHSFRHSFITKARHQGQPVDKIQQVVGHEKIKAGVTDRYTHRYPINDLVCVVDAITY